ncbi:olfactory receptor 8H1-like [Bombina bombina]|uniref:olfactory receptor 8H1-like n=1 Tax=Bombina bombina TaxID=8345 RepID=UPI00235A8D6A|nr:olfactory receptor 8H1-like [Bombina bombina]
MATLKLLKSVFCTSLLLDCIFSVALTQPMKTDAIYNKTNVNEFIILGFSSVQEYQNLFLAFFLTIYLITLTVNISLLTIIRLSLELHKPMYFFLGNLSFLELGYISVTVPKIVLNIINNKKSISFSGCFAQLFFFTFLGATEIILLAVMSFDRYLAVCFPLRYTSIMTQKTCYVLAAVSWVFSFLTTSFPIIKISELHFCSANVINHFFCEAAPLLKLSCSDTYFEELFVIICASSVTITSVLLTMVSYGCILRAILKIPSVTGKQKAASTCASHLIVVTAFYSTVIAMYIKPTGSKGSLNKIMALVYAVFTPFVNPFIYSLRNKEVKDAFFRHVLKKGVQ